MLVKLTPGTADPKPKLQNGKKGNLKRAILKREKKEKIFLQNWTKKRVVAQIFKFHFKLEKVRGFFVTTLALSFICSKLGSLDYGYFEFVWKFECSKFECSKFESSKFKSCKFESSKLESSKFHEIWLQGIETYKFRFVKFKANINIWTFNQVG